jgi:hypothetical protein
MESSDVAEIKRHFNVVAESLEKKIQLVAEGVSALDDRVGRVEDRMMSLEEKMERGFDEVKAMIKFSYAELHVGELALASRGASLLPRLLRETSRAATGAGPLPGGVSS